MKRVVCVVLAIFLLLTFVGCSSPLEVYLSMLTTTVSPQGSDAQTLPTIRNIFTTATARPNPTEAPWEDTEESFGNEPKVTPTATPKPTVAPTPTPTAAPTEIPSPVTTGLATPIPGNKRDKFYYKQVDCGWMEDWAVEGDLVYAVFSEKNLCAVFDSDTGNILIQAALGDAPSEIQLSGNDVWISYPKTKCVRVYDKKTLAEKRTVQLENPPYSFDVADDYLIYGAYEPDESDMDRVYRYQFATKEETMFFAFISATDILIAPDQKTVYLGAFESGGANVYYYDLDTMEQKSMYEGEWMVSYRNPQKLFLTDGNLYWDYLCLDASNVARVKKQYDVLKEILFVDSTYMITNKEVLMKQSQERVMLLSSRMAAITESGNLMMADGGSVLFYPDFFA